MITITQADKEIHGPDIFSVALENQLVCRFKLEKREGLADCLQRAADAVELSEWADFVIMDDSKGG